MRMTILGHADRRSGFGRVSSTLQRELADLGVDVDLLDPRSKTVAAVSAASPGDEPELVRWTSSLQDQLRVLRPDVLLSIGDVWAYALARRVLREALPAVPAIAYFVVDHELTSPFLGRAFADLDYLVAPTEWGCGLVRRLLGRRCDRIRISVIPHGVDRRRFFPIGAEHENGCRRLEVREQLRRKLFPQRSDIWRSFLVLNGNQNVPRKRLDLTLYGFRRFAETARGDVRLVLHGDPASQEQDLQPLIRSLGLQDRVVRLSAMGSRAKVSDATLNELYNACDVGLNTAMGEGWGMVSLEHAATGAAQVVTDLPSLAEIWCGAALPIPVDKQKMHGPHEQTCYVATPDDVAQCLQRAYFDHLHENDGSRRAFEHACRPEFSWSRIAAQWYEIALQVIASRCAA